MASIIDVAKRAGVSPTTAKRAIREPHLLAPKTLERVLKAVEELDYEPDLTAGALRRGKNLSVGLVIGDILEPFFARLTRTIGQEVRTRGYSLLIAENQYDSDLELTHLKMFNGWKLSGLIVRSAYGRANYDYLERMQQRGTVIVEIDYVHAHSPFNQIMLDNPAAVEEGVRHLHSLNHQRIAPIGMQNTPEHPEERARGFAVTMKALGLHLPEAYLPGEYRRYKGMSEELAYELTRHLMGLTPPPTALLPLTGTCAAGCFRALQDLGVDIPRDVSVVAFDDNPWTSLVVPHLDVLAQPVDEMGRAAAKLVLDEIETPTQAVIRQRFRATLIERGSSAPTT